MSLNFTIINSLIVGGKGRLSAISVIGNLYVYRSSQIPTPFKDGTAILICY